MYPPKKPVGGKTFPQGREILQVFKNWGGRQTHSQHQKQSKPPKPKPHNKQQEQQ